MKIPYKLSKAEYGKYYGVLKRRYGCVGVRNIEPFEKGGWHSHAVVFPYIGKSDMEKARWGTWVGHVDTQICGGDSLGSYMTKEMWKGLKEGGDPRCGWTSFGRWPGRTIRSEYKVHTVFKDAMSLAWAMREKGWSRKRIYEEAMKIYWHWVQTKPIMIAGEM